MTMELIAKILQPFANEHGVNITNSFNDDAIIVLDKNGYKNGILFNRYEAEDNLFDLIPSRLKAFSSQLKVD